MQSKTKSRLILMRHGESLWNLANLFTGWIDIPLSTKGIEEALQGGEKIKDLPIDIIFTSTLIRAIMTAMLAMSVHHSKKAPVILHDGEGRLGEWSKNYAADPDALTIPVLRSWQLNERMYGELQGLNKAETMERFGKEQVQIWRRSYDVSPPSGESLKMTAARTLPYFEEQILPCLKAGKNVFVAAHGNSLRSIIMSLDNLDAEQVVKLEIETGMPIIYHYEDGRIVKQSP